MKPGNRSDALSAQLCQLMTGGRSPQTPCVASLRSFNTWQMYRKRKRDEAAS